MRRSKFEPDSRPENRAAQGKSDRFVDPSSGIYNSLNASCFAESIVVRYLSPEDDPNTLLMWVSPSDSMPDCCCHCGMFTADRVKVRHEYLLETDESPAVTAWGILHLLLMLLGGPIGWLFALASAGEEKKEGPTTVSKTFKIQMPLCILCRAEVKPKILATRTDRNLCQLWVHPQFAERYQRENPDAD